MNPDHSYSVLSGNLDANGLKCSGWDQFDDIIKQFLKEQSIPGAVVAISRNGDIIYKQGFGMAGCSRRVLPDSAFRIASISKPITAAVVLHVCKKAGISLDAPVFGKRGILKKYRVQDKRAKKISIRHLLQHSAGWDRDKVGDAVFVRPKCVIEQHPDSQEFNVALLSHSLRRKLQFTPGTWHAYSNLGYLALGQVVQAITGSDFSNVLQGFLANLEIDGIKIGQRGRTHWRDVEVEYFNNKEPTVVESIYPGEGFVLPMYGGMAMPSSASYGGLVSDTTSLLKFVHCMEVAVMHHCRENEGQVEDVNKSSCVEGKDDIRKLNEKNGDHTERTILKHHLKNESLNGFQTVSKGEPICYLEKDLETPLEFIMSEAVPFDLEETVSILDFNALNVITDNIVGDMLPSSSTIFDHHQDSHNVDESRENDRSYVSHPHELKRHHTRPLMSPSQAENSLACPTYENESAGSWYGLGWDVELGGESWGHTGGMEGTCGTLRHHEPWGISWAFLLNSWAQDCDLDGVIKSGIMMSMGQALPERGLCDLIERLGYAGIKVTSKNGHQVVLVNVTQTEIIEELPQLKDRGFFVTWLSCISQNLVYDAGGQKESYLVQDLQDNMGGCFSGLYHYKESVEERYCFILTNTGCPFKDFSVVLDKSLQDLDKLITEFEQKAFFLTFLDSFCKENSLRYMAVFRQDFHPPTSNCSFSAALANSHQPVLSQHQIRHNAIKPAYPPSSAEPSLSFEKDALFCEECAKKPNVHLAIPAEDYVKKIKTLIESHTILVQSVTEVGHELWVSVVLRSFCKSQSNSLHLHKGVNGEKWDDKVILNRCERRRVENLCNKAKCCDRFHDQTNYKSLGLDSSHAAKCNPSHKNLKPFSKKNKHNSYDREFVSSTLTESPQAVNAVGEDQLKRTEGATTPHIKSLRSPVSPNRKSPRLRTQSSSGNFYAYKKVQSISKQKKTPKLNKNTSSQTNNVSVYWVQITPESFLTELNKQIQKDRSLQYCKFYTVSGKPYVSAVWQQTTCVGKTTSKSKCIPPGFSEKSKEFENGQCVSEFVPPVRPNCDLPYFDQTSVTSSRYHRIALSKYGLLPELAEAAWSNHRLQSLSEYREEDGSVYYAALWLP